MEPVRVGDGGRALSGRLPNGPCAALAVLLAGAAVAEEMRVQERTSPQCLPAQWSEELWPDPDTVRFLPTTLEEREAFTRLFPPLLRAAADGAGQPPPDLVEAAAAVGFRIDVWRTARDRFWVLREQPERRRGAGAYVIRTGPASNDFIQAPHAYFDLGTGGLAARLFACASGKTRPRLFATNTAHRFRGRPDERRDDPDHIADVAHNPDHLFQQVTDLAAQTMASLRLFQLHGFAAGTRGRSADLVAVVSAGSRRPPAAVRTISNRLATLLGGGVRLFPDETDLLGATQNAQARLLQEYPGTTFVHLELSADVRRVLASAEQLARVTEALLSAPEE